MIDKILKDRLRSYVYNFRNYSKEFGIDALLLVAIAIKESSLQPDSFREEPAFYNKYVKKLTNKRIKTYNPFAVTPEDVAKERDAEGASYGLMQVMGLTAREMGYRGKHLRDLHDPKMGIYYGAKYLKQKLVKYAGDAEKAISAYNAGTFTDHNHADYVVPVLEYYNQLKEDVEVKSWFENSQS